MILRPYQEKALSDLRAALARYQRVLLVMPTGAGKGTLATHIIRAANAKGNRVIFLVNRRTLVHDMVKRLERLGLYPGIIMGDSSRGQHAPVLVASIQTLVNRAVPRAQVVFIDEAHFSMSKMWKHVLAKYQDSKVIGMTATPIRLDGQGLGENFQHIVLGPSVKELVAQGDLVPYKFYAPYTPNLAGVHVRQGEWAQDELGQKMDKPKLVGDIVAHWRKLAEGLPTVGFAVNCAHGEHIRDEFLKVGIKARFVSGETPDRERDQTWDDLRTGALSIAMSVGIISFGWDAPWVSCMIDAQPSRSLAKVLQKWGRPMRPYAAKDHFTILDHAGNYTHGFPDDDRTWSLEGRVKKSRTPIPPEKLPRVCPKCALVWPAGTRVCSCGYQFAEAAPIMHEPGELQELKRYSINDYAKFSKPDEDDPALEALVSQARRMNYKPGWLFHMRAALEHQRARYQVVFGEPADKCWHAGGLVRMIDERSTG